MKQWAEQFYKSVAWIQTREQYLKSVDHLCERCMQRGDYVIAKIVHHKVYITRENITNPDVVLNWENLEALCQNCHNAEHFSEYSEKRFSFSADGKIIHPPH